MNIIVNGRHLEITPALRDYAESKMKKFEKYLSTITEATVTLSIEKYRHKAEVLLKANGVMIQAESVTGEIYSSIDEVIEKLERQIKKYKGKLTSHRKENRSQALPTQVFTERAHPEIKIIKRKRFAMKPMTDEEAALQMELLDKDFFVFTNANSGVINVIYKRRDGDFGLIEPA
jgi:putative sigma-54 modulation protein